MTDRPILFSAPMVRALLDGRKTQTRRMLNPQPEEHLGMNCRRLRFFNRKGVQIGDASPDPGGSADIFTSFSVGDRLWVKETWHTGEAYDDLKPSDLGGEESIWYPADRSSVRHLGSKRGKTRVSIFMPRWASRLTLTVTDVRVQRLQDCSEVDAIQEGVTLIEESLEDPVEAYAALWDSINGRVAWDDNPWVVAVSFDVELRNIDQ